MAKKKTGPESDEQPVERYEMVRIAELTSDPKNARKHGSGNLKAISQSLTRFGQVKPIIIDAAGVVIAGNGTLEAARQLGWETIECRRVDLAGAEAAAYSIADNRTAELAEWDDDILRATLELIRDEDEALLEAAGYTDDGLSQMLVDAMANAEVEGGDDNPGVIDDSVSISFPVTAEQESLFRKAVAQAKKTFGVSATGEAVAKIMEQWIGQVQ